MKLTASEEKILRSHISTLEDIQNSAFEIINIYNEALNAAREFVEETKNRLQEEFDAKSESWQESERGNSATDMIAEWENLDLGDDVDLSDTLNHSGLLEDLPTESES